MQIFMLKIFAQTMTKCHVIAVQPPLPAQSIYLFGHM